MKFVMDVGLLALMHTSYILMLQLRYVWLENRDMSIAQVID